MTSNPSKVEPPKEDSTEVKPSKDSSPAAELSNDSSPAIVEPTKDSKPSTKPVATEKLAGEKDGSPKKDSGKEQEVGGITEFHKVDEGIIQVVAQVEDEIRNHIQKLLKGNEKVPTKLDIIGYRINVVLGHIFFVKIRIPGDSFVQARILRSPKGEVTLQTVMETKTDADEKEYFKFPC